tara:strand:- start:4991 stop:5323 length:333 start_codon:yes stop_codon:yes gene_type:complete
MAVYANLTIDQGSDFSSTIFVTNNQGDILDLTLYTTRAQIRKTFASTTSIDFIASILNPTEGKIQIKLTNAVSALMKSGRYVYDVEIISDSDIVTRVVEGQVDVTPNVSR